MNSFLPVDPALIDVVEPEDGYPDHLAAADTPDVLIDACGAASKAFPKSLWIDPKDRADKARENDKNKTWGVNRIDRFTNQTPTHECTCHMLRAQFEGARNLARGVTYPEPKKIIYPEAAKFGSVFVSPQSIYAQVNPKTRNNPQQRGGANCYRVLEVAIKTGFLPDKIQPRDYGFKHYLHGTSGQGNECQSHGPYISVGDFPDGWQETAKLLRPLEVIVTTDWEEALCLLLHGFVLGYGRDGHAVPPSFWNVASDAYGYVDSYNRILYDSAARFRRACASGVHSIISTTTPDDWNNPAG